MYCWPRPCSCLCKSGCRKFRSLVGGIGTKAAPRIGTAIGFRPRHVLSTELECPCAQRREVVFTRPKPIGFPKHNAGSGRVYHKPAVEAERPDCFRRRRYNRRARRPDRSGRRGIPLAASDRCVSVPGPSSCDPQQGHELDRCRLRSPVSSGCGTFRVGRLALVGDREPAGGKPAWRVVRRGMGDNAGLEHTLSRHCDHAAAHRRRSVDRP